MTYQDTAEGRLDPSTYAPRARSEARSDKHQKPSFRALLGAAVTRVFSLLVLLAVSPFLLTAALVILAAGRNPLFLQERVGLGGRQFLIFKFRTMPDEGWKEAKARAKDSPLARLRLKMFWGVSWVLRNTGLDELPQFANIVKGDMHIVGPRPLMMKDFLDLPERRMERCAVLPGITGLAQINGGQDLDPASKLALDLHLINNLSFAMVRKIIWRTVLRVFLGSKATAEASEADLADARRAMARSAAQPAPEAAAEQVMSDASAAASASASTTASARTSAALTRVLPANDPRPRGGVRRPGPSALGALPADRQDELSRTAP